MKIFLAIAEDIHNYIGEKKIDYGLFSFAKHTPQNWKFVNQNCNEILIDSGAFTFLNGGNTRDFEHHVSDYINFVKHNTNQSNVLGFFEMDVGRVLGENTAMDIRKDLNKASDKIIPVWHPHQGLDGYYKMLEEYKGKRVAIAQALEKLEDGQYNLFLNTAHKYNCSMHILGFTRVNMFEKLNFGKNDSVDSASWEIGPSFGNIILSHRGGIQGIKLGIRGIWQEQRKLYLYNFINLMKYYKEYDNA